MLEYENVKLSKEDIKKVSRYSELSDADLDSIIEMVWQYSIVAYNAYNKSIIVNAYE